MRWDLTEQAFDRFLAWLHPDRDEAGKKYEEIRRHLIIILTCRGCTEAEAHKDRLNGKEWDAGYGYGLVCASEAVNAVRTFCSPGESVAPLSARPRR